MFDEKGKPNGEGDRIACPTDEWVDVGIMFDFASSSVSFYLDGVFVKRYM